MVRLKEQFTNVEKTTTLISIPYGAIKSNYDLVIGGLGRIFQFLMVRLKDFRGHNGDRVRY